MHLNKLNDEIVSSVKAINLKAWSERWSVDRWSRAVKLYLPCFATEKIQLADILFEHVNTTSIPNSHILDCLKHSLLCQTISFSSLTKNLTTFTDIKQTYCLLSLVKFLSSVFNCLVTMISNENPIQTGKGWLQIYTWLLTIIKNAALQLQQSNNQEQHENCKQLFELSVKLVNSIVQNHYIYCLISVAMLEDKEEDQTSHSPNTTTTPKQQPHDVIDDVVSEMKKMMTQQISKDVHGALESIVKVDKSFSMRILTKPPSITLPITHHPINTTLSFLVFIEAYLNPYAPLQQFLHKILTVEKLQGLTRSSLYCELLRAAFVGMVDADVKPEDVKWSAFIYIKIPLLFKSLSGSTAQSGEIVQAFNELLQFNVLLDSVDHKCRSDCLQYLLNELSNKHSLIPEAMAKKIMNKRHSKTMRKKLTLDSSPPSTVKEPAYLILRAEPTVNSILKSLDTNKNQELILGVMSQMMSGKSFELISAAAATTGRLGNFVSKLIKINECATQFSAADKSAAGGKQMENTKNSMARATLFDISFLMLCHTIQFYHIDIISSCTDCTKTFFYQWATQSLPRHGKFKPPTISSTLDQSKLDSLLNQFSSGSELAVVGTKWSDVCASVPTVVKEFITAWKDALVSEDHVKTMTDSIKSPICSLAVVGAVWLCNNINVADNNNQEKCLKMLGFLLQVKPCEKNVNNYHERSQLAKQFMTHIFDLFGTHPNNKKLNITTTPTTTTTTPKSSPQSTPPPTSTPQQPTPPLTSHPHVHTTYIFKPRFSDSMADSLVKSFEVLLDHPSVHHLLNVQCIFTFNSPIWVSRILIKELHKHKTKDMLDRAVMTLHSIHHIDLPTFTSTLLNHILPDALLYSDDESSLILDPWGSSLAKLCLINLASLYHLNQSQHNNQAKKRKTRENDGAEDAKKMKMEEEKGVKDGQGDGNKCTDLKGKSDNDDDNETTMIKELSKSLGHLFDLFQKILSCEMVCKECRWVLTFIKMTLTLPDDVAHFILQHASPPLVMSLIRHCHDFLSPYHLHHFVQTTPSNTQLSDPLQRELLAKYLFALNQQKTLESAFHSL